MNRKSRLRKLLGKRSDGILYNDHMESDGQLVFEHACQFGCEGIVAKRADSLYRSGRSKSWLKIKNPKSPAMLRVEEGTFAVRYLALGDEGSDRCVTYHSSNILSEDDQATHRNR